MIYQPLGFTLLVMHNMERDLTVECFDTSGNSQLVGEKDFKYTIRDLCAMIVFCAKPRAKALNTWRTTLLEEHELRKIYDDGAEGLARMQ